MLPDDLHRAPPAAPDPCRPGRLPRPPSQPAPYTCCARTLPWPRPAGLNTPASFEPGVQREPDSTGLQDRHILQPGTGRPACELIAQSIVQIAAIQARRPNLGAGCDAHIEGAVGRQAD